MRIPWPSSCLCSASKRFPCRLIAMWTCPRQTIIWVKPVFRPPAPTDTWLFIWPAITRLQFLNYNFNSWSPAKAGQATPPTRHLRQEILDKTLSFSYQICLFKTILDPPDLLDLWITISLNLSDTLRDNDSIWITLYVWMAFKLFLANIFVCRLGHSPCIQFQ